MNSNLTVKDKICLDCPANTLILPQGLEFVLDTYQGLYGKSSSYHHTGHRESNTIDDSQAVSVNGLGANSLNGLNLQL